MSGKQRYAYSLGLGKQILVEEVNPPARKKRRPEFTAISLQWAVDMAEAAGMPGAALLVFWLVFLFASFGLFAPHNLTSAVVLTLFALAVAGAVGWVPHKLMITRT